MTSSGKEKGLEHAGVWPPSITRPLGGVSVRRCFQSIDEIQHRLWFSGQVRCWEPVLVILVFAVPAGFFDGNRPHLKFTWSTLARIGCVHASTPRVGIPLVRLRTCLHLFAKCPPPVVLGAHDGLRRRDISLGEGEDKFSWCRREKPSMSTSLCSSYAHGGVLCLTLMAGYYVFRSWRGTLSGRLWCDWSLRPTFGPEAVSQTRSAQWFPSRLGERARRTAYCCPGVAS